MIGIQCSRHKLSVVSSGIFLSALSRLQRPAIASQRHRPGWRMSCTPWY